MTIGRCDLCGCTENIQPVSFWANSRVCTLQRYSGNLCRFCMSHKYAECRQTTLHGTWWWFPIFAAGMLTGLYVLAENYIKYLIANVRFSLIGHDSKKVHELIGKMIDGQWGESLERRAARPQECQEVQIVYGPGKSSLEKYFCKKSEYSTKADPRKAEDAADLEKCELAQYYFEQGDAYYYGAEDKNGAEIDSDFKEAVKWFLKAAEMGNNEAQYGLALAYCNGEGVPKDYVQAHKWFYISSEALNVGTRLTLPNPSAEEQMEDVAKFMTPEQIAEAQKLAREWKPK